MPWAEFDRCSLALDLCVCSLWLIEYNFVHLQIRSNAECIVGQYFIPGSTPLTLAHNQTLFHTAHCSHTEQHTAHSTQHIAAHCWNTQHSMKMHHTHCEPHTFQTSRFTFLFILPAWLLLHKLQCNPHNFVKILVFVLVQELASSTRKTRQLFTTTSIYGRIVQCRPAVLTLHNLETFTTECTRCAHSAHFVQTEEEWRWQLPQ